VTPRNRIIDQVYECQIVIYSTYQNFQKMKNGDKSDKCIISDSSVLGCGHNHKIVIIRLGDNNLLVQYLLIYNYT